MRIGDLSIRLRLGLVFGAMGVMLMAIAVMSIVMLSSSNGRIKSFVSEQLPENEAAQALLASEDTIALGIRNMMLNEDPADRQKQMEAITAARLTMQEKIKYLDDHLHSPKSREIFDGIVQNDRAYRQVQEDQLKLINGGSLDEAKALQVQKGRPLFATYKQSINEEIETLKSQMKTTADEVDQGYAAARNWLIALTLLVLGGAAALTWWIMDSITRPLAQALTIANTVAAGDLTTRVETNSDDEIGRLLRAMQTMNDKLVEMVSTVRSGTETIASASTEIASGNLDLSSRTEQQAASLEETASSMEELTSTVQQNAENARQANMLAADASEIAQRGGAVVSEVVGTMNSINDSSRKIVDIISVIDGIAFQTNILALNAAVEAARAGEQGRGFAVVAGEVRTLAQRSANAAKEIKALISESVEKVEAGGKLVDQAGATMDEVVSSVRRVTDIIAEIAEASAEQRSGIEQVSRAITQMDDVTQQNAALVEEAAAAANSMKDQASQLSQLVLQFKIDGTQAAKFAVKAPARPKPVTKPRKAGKPPVPAAAPRAAAAVPRQTQMTRAAATTGDDWEEF